MLAKNLKFESGYKYLNDGVGNQARHGKSGAYEADGKHARPEHHLSKVEMNQLNWSTLFMAICLVSRFCLSEASRIS